MDAAVKNSEALVFHLSGRTGGAALRPIAGLGLRPALLAPYRDLAALRHDFPIVLAPTHGHAFVHTLSALVDQLLHDVAPRGIEGERLRRHALQLEREIREAVAGGARGTLAELWAAAAARLGAREGATLEEVLARSGTALHADGEVLDCTPEMPARLLRHAWLAAQDAKARRFRHDLARLVQKLSDILRAARAHSVEGRLPASLRAAVGAPHHAQFDFERLSMLVAKGVPEQELSAARRERLVRTLATLEAQRFFALDDGPASDLHGFEFEDCAAASRAFAERLPEAAGLIKAIAIAELEARGAYVEAEHDLVFEAFGAHSVSAEDLARLPDYLVCIPSGRNEAPENAQMMAMLSSGLPVKVLVQTSDLAEEAAIGGGSFAFGVRSARLATTAMGLGGMFVLQAAASSLFAMREAVAAGMAAKGPALFSVYSAVGDAGPADRLAGGLPPYLATAVATQSRAFANFSYDAAAGSNWATRFSLRHNPQPEADWPVETIVYADEKQQRQTLALAFTYADFALADPRNAAHFALLPRASWHDAQLLPLADWLALPEADAARRVPYLLAVDADDRLERVLVDARLAQATRRCLLLWRRLQEHGGIHDAYAEALLAREKAAWAAAAPAPAPAAAEPAPAGTTPARSRDEAWIETERCPSCNECQLINDRMFAYDERKQAFIKDITAGTYRQLVEAAESCQVAIIHPGQPRDPNEPGLPELLARAEPFR